MGRSWFALVVVGLGLIAACYEPRAPEGAPCDTTQDCPSLQRCVLGRCATRDPLIDAAPQLDALEIDASVAPDARPDAMVLPCTTTGLACQGTAVTFMCGGHCWVRCPTSLTWPSASTVCAGWSGVLGAIDDATEQSCVEMRVGGNNWIGLRQSDTATAPARDWAWNTPATLVTYTHWQSGGIPDDQDSNEDRDEQCGKIQDDGTWDDLACGTGLPYLCERP